VESEGRVTKLPSLGPQGSQRRRLLFFAVWAPIALGVLVFFREVLTPFALAVVLAYVLAPVVAGLQRLRVGQRRMPRWVAVVLVYVTLLGALGGAVAFAAPRLVVEITRAAREAPEAIHALREEWLPQVERALRSAAALYGDDEEPVTEPTPSPADEDAPPGIRVVPNEDGSYEIRLPADGIEIVHEDDDAYRVRIDRRTRAERRDLVAFVADSIRDFFSDTEAYAGTALRGAQTVVRKVVGGVFSFFIMLMLSAYILVTSDRILTFFRRLSRPSRRDRFDDLVARIDRGLAGVVRGQLLIALVNGVLSGIGFWLLDLPYWPVLTLIATVLSIIPIFGAIISSVPAVLVGLQLGVGTAALVLVWIIVIHQIEANLLNPKIMGDAAKVHPVLVVFALLAGEHVFGIVGALLAVPLLSITQSVFLHFREVALGVPKDPKLAEQWAEATLDRAPDEEVRLAVAEGYHKLLTYKDEYETARLLLDTERQAQEVFDGDLKFTYHLAPPIMGAKGPNGRPKKREFGGWMRRGFRLLAAMKPLRGTPFDPFRYAAERKMERALITQYEADMGEVLGNLRPENREPALALATLPLQIRGFGPVKEANAAKAAKRREELLDAFRNPEEGLKQAAE